MVRLSYASIVFLLSLTALPAQTFSVGVKGGVPVTNDIDSYSATSESKRYTVGPMVNVALGYGVNVEAAALYRRIGYRSGGADGFGGFSATVVRGNSWEFPIVLRKSLRRGVFAAAGYAPLVITGSRHSSGYQTKPYQIPLQITYYEGDYHQRWNTTNGIVGVAGVQRRAGKFHIAPEIRNTLWTRPALEEYGSRGYTLLSSQHQIDLLVTIRFP